MIRRTCVVLVVLFLTVAMVGCGPSEVKYDRQFREWRDEYNSIAELDLQNNDQVMEAFERQTELYDEIVLADVPESRAKLHQLNVETVGLRRDSLYEYLSGDSASAATGRRADEAQAELAKELDRIANGE